MDRNDQLVKILLIVIALVVLFPILVMMFAWPMMGVRDGGHMWGWHGEPVSVWFTFFMWFIPLSVILAVGYLLYRGLVSSADRSGDPALEELRLAYARGDLTDEEFETRRQRLRSEE